MGESMSADDYLNCPKCGAENSVRIEGINDYFIFSDGKIISKIVGKCNKCKMEFNS